MLQIKEVPDDVHRILKARAGRSSRRLAAHRARSLRDDV
jgi:plasmid stability protein